MRRAAIALLPVVLIAACGDGEEEVAVEATPAAVQAAGEATLEASSAEVEFSMTWDVGSMGLPGLDEPIEIDGSGVIDFAGGRAELEFDLGALVEQLGDQVPAQAAAMFEEPIRSIQDGTTAYVCGSFLAAIGGAECLSIDLTSFGAGGSALPGAGVDGEALLQSLGGADGVEDVGEEEILGTTTRHLRGTFSVADALAQLPEDEAARAQAAFESMGVGADFLDVQHDFDVWIDGDGLVRQIRQTIDIGSAVPEAEGAEPIVVEFRYLEFDVPVDIQIPTDATDISELGGLFGG